MRRAWVSGLGTTVALLLATITLLGCAFGEYRRAQIAEQQGDWDKAVLDYLALVQRQPDNLSYKSGLLRAKMAASHGHFDAGRKLAAAGDLERALFEYRQAVELDPTNQYAATEMGKARDALAAREKQSGQNRTVEEMKKEAQARSQPPMLNPRSNQPISLQFPNPVSIKDIYRALGKAFGINILFDPNLKDQEIAIELKDVTAQDALEILMRAAQHFYKVLDEHTILIAADTPQNRRAYEDLVIQTFFLSNADVKDVLTMLRTLVDAKKIASDERLNAIVMRDSIDRVKVAERLIQTNDKARAEVVVDVELLQVNSQKIRDIGTSLSSYSITQALMPGLGVSATTPNTIGLDDLKNLNRTSWSLTIPNFVYNFVKTNTDAQVLARPQLRISEGEKAALLIGDKVPIPTTTFNTSNTVGGNIVPITSFQYQDVGIKINIEPRVHHNLEVTLKLHVEVSNLGAPVSVGNGQEQPTISTRQVDTVIRLKDGETNFLAGLLRTDEATSDSGLPGISEIPLIGRLLSHSQRNGQRTDVILTMTPHIIRRSDITESDLMPIWVGTEQNITFRGGSPRVESETEGGPFDEGASAADRVRELIRQRVQELPPGLENGAEEGGAMEEPPGEAPTPPQKAPPTTPGVDLNPPAFPSATPAQAPVPPPQVEEPEEPQGSARREAPLQPGAGREGGAQPAAAAPQQARVTLAPAAGGGVETRGASLAETKSPAGVTLAVGPAGVAATGLDGAAATQRVAAVVRLRLVPGALAVAAGDRFELRVEADARQPLSHLPLVVTYDPAVLTAVAWARGDLLGGDGEAELLGAVAAPGRLLLGASRLGQRPGVTGQGTAAVITFEARRAGAAAVRIERPKALGPGLEDLPTSAQPAVVRVSAVGGRPAGGDGSPGPGDKAGPHA